jgi:hypothetical protein
MSFGSSYSAASSRGGNIKETDGSTISAFRIIFIGFPSSITIACRIAEGNRFGESQPCLKIF